MTILRTIYLTAVLLIACARVHAQTDPDSVYAPSACRLARQVLETGEPARHTAWALRQIGACGPATHGATLADAVRRLRAETDTAQLREFWRASRYLRDGELFRASLDVAGNRGASPQARVFALLSLLHTVRVGRSADYRHMVGGFEEDSGLRRVRGGCARIFVSDDVRIVGSPLPADYGERVRTLAQRLRKDVTEPLDVQTAASCL